MFRIYANFYFRAELFEEKRSRHPTWGSQEYETEVWPQTITKRKEDLVRKASNSSSPIIKIGSNHGK